MFAAVLSTATMWCLAAQVARADPTPPTNSTPPTISGTAQQGDQLTADPGTWSGDTPITFDYEWSDGQEGNPITLSAADVGQNLTVTVTASNDAGPGTAPATSDAYGPVAAAVEAPVSTPGSGPAITGFTGTPQQGETLSVSNGAWDNNPTGYSYEWEDCDSTGTICSTIDGAISSTYALRSSDVGSTVVALVTASNDGGQTLATSNVVGPVSPAAPVATPGSGPTITGQAQQGNTLSVSNGAWSNGPTQFSYVWQDCNSSGTSCAPISGATSSSYTLQVSDVGSFVAATVTASNSGGQGSSTVSTTRAVLPAVPQDSTAPGIAGVPQQGVTLSASNGVWINNPTAYSYAWEDCTGPGTNCTAISGAKSSTYKLTAGDVGKYVNVTVTASNLGGQASVTTTSVGPVLPPAPVNTTAPSLTGTAEQGKTLSVTNGSWSNGPTSYSYAWEHCNSSGSCSPIPGATSSSYTLSAADIGATIICVVTASGPGGQTAASSGKTASVAAAPTPAGSLPTTTSLLASPTSAVTNQPVTLIATVTSVVSTSTALWGTVTFDDGGAPIEGCAEMAVTPSGQSATVACSASFAASSASLSAVFSPSAGSVLAGSVSPGETVVVGLDSTSTTLDVSPKVDVGANTTYTATVSPPPSRLGPVEPTGSVEFLDSGQPIASCTLQPLTNGGATCTVTYATSGAHSITARYLGDPNFTGSSSPAESVNVAPVPTNVLGTITATMEWAFYYTPSYTKVSNLVVNGVSSGATVLVRCSGRGCPFARHTSALTKRTRCGKKKKAMCFTSGSFNITPGFASRRLATGTRVTIEIIRPAWIGKYYRFTMRARRGPRVQIACLAPGGSVPDAGC